MIIIPDKETILCECVVESKRNIESGGVFYEQEALPEYKIISVGKDVVEYNAGDIIICDSTGTKLNVPNKGVQYLFNVEHIAGKIITK